MKEILEEIAAESNYIFEYARRDHLNLFDDVSNDLVPHLFVDPIIEDEVHDDMNVLEQTNYSGNFMFVMSSDLDEESYAFRYENYIKPLRVELKKLKDSVSCGYEVTFKQWRIVEVINMLDQNMDGLVVSFNIEIKE
jgi:hypothetical protein